MIAADTSVLIAYFKGETGSDVDKVAEAIEGKRLLLPPVVQTELLSDPKIAKELEVAISVIPVLEIKGGYWRRAGLSRAKVIAKGYKARVADALIAQSCIDNNIELVSRDKDFKAFSIYCNLKLSLG